MSDQKKTPEKDRLKDPYFDMDEDDPSTYNVCNHCHKKSHWRSDYCVHCGWGMGTRPGKEGEYIPPKSEPFEKQLVKALVMALLIGAAVHWGIKGITYLINLLRCCLSF